MTKSIRNHDGLCWKCLNNLHPDDIIQIEIPAIGYGSQFDTFSTKIQLCKDCIDTTEKTWWKLNVIKCYINSTNMVIWTAYEYEEEILKFVDALPICGRELFFNSCANNEIRMEPQNWINYIEANQHDIA